MNAWRMRLPSCVRIGMFCKLGSLDDNRPVTATAWWYEVCTRPVFGSICSGSFSV